MKGVSHVNYNGVYNDGKQNYPYNENVKKKYNNNEALWANKQKEILDEYGSTFYQLIHLNL